MRLFVHVYVIYGLILFLYFFVYDLTLYYLFVSYLWMFLIMLLLFFSQLSVQLLQKVF